MKKFILTMFVLSLFACTTPLSEDTMEYIETLEYVNSNLNADIHVLKKLNEESLQLVEYVISMRERDQEAVAYYYWCDWVGNFTGWCDPDFQKLGAEAVKRGEHAPLTWLLFYFMAGPLIVGMGYAGFMVILYMGPQEWSRNRNNWSKMLMQRERESLEQQRKKFQREHEHIRALEESEQPLRRRIQSLEKREKSLMSSIRKLEQRHSQLKAELEEIRRIDKALGSE